MSNRGKRDSRRVPTGAWWLLTFLAYWWGFKEGEISGYMRCAGAWSRGFREGLQR